jgi:hypothetical protein
LYGSNHANLLCRKHASQYAEGKQATLHCVDAVALRACLQFLLQL